VVSLPALRTGRHYAPGNIPYFCLRLSRLQGYSAVGRKLTRTSATKLCYATFATRNALKILADCFWNVMAHAQKQDFVFRRNGRVHLNRQGRHFSRLLAAEVCASAVVMLDTPCSDVVRRVLATHSIRQFPLHFPSRTSPCAITFQLGSNNTQRTGQNPNHSTSKLPL